MPAGVPGFTSTLPVAGSKTSCAGTVEPVATVRMELAVVAAALLMVSPVKAFTTAVAPVAPLMPVALSLVATRGAASTTTVTTAVLQLATGFRFSQS